MSAEVKPHCYVNYLGTGWSFSGCCLNHDDRPFLFFGPVLGLEANVCVFLH